MDFLATWPDWAIMGLIGGVAGAIGGFVGWLAQKGLGRQVTGIFVAGAAGLGVVGGNLLLPSIRDSDAAACQSAEAAADLTNRTRGGANVDAVTIMNAMVVDCDGRTVTYTMTITVPAARLDEAAWAAAARDFSAFQCGNATWRRYIDDGWAISNFYTFPDGATRSLTAVCTG